MFTYCSFVSKMTKKIIFSRLLWLESYCGNMTNTFVYAAVEVGGSMNLLNRNIMIINEVDLVRELHEKVWAFDWSCQIS